MEEEIIKTQQDRVRINVSTSVKGVKTYDCTVEVNGDPSKDPIIDTALNMSDSLVASLDERYPAGNIGGVAQITLDDAPSG